MSAKRLWRQRARKLSIRVRWRVITRSSPGRWCDSIRRFCPIPTLVKSDLTRAPEMPSSEDAELKLDFGFKVEHSYKEGEKRLAAFVRFFAKGEFVENDET